MSTTRRNSISDYPEHLNPFYDGNDRWHFWGKIKRSGSFSNSLKDLRNTITLRSFRGHKKPKSEKDDVQLRKNRSLGQPTLSRQTIAAIRSPSVLTSTPLLPRSRFSERVRIRKSTSDIDVSSYDSSKNPFENEADEEEVKISYLKPDDYSKKVKRRKRRAPLPPGMKDSSWSLTSVETDVSSYTQSEISDLDISEIEKPMDEICEMLQTFTKEIEKMTDSFNYADSLKLENEEEFSHQSDPKSEIENLQENKNVKVEEIIISPQIIVTEDGEMIDNIVDERIILVQENETNNNCEVGERQPPLRKSSKVKILENIMLHDGQSIENNLNDEDIKTFYHDKSKNEEKLPKVIEETKDDLINETSETKSLKEATRKSENGNVALEEQHSIELQIIQPQLVHYPEKLQVSQKINLDHDEEVAVNDAEENVIDEENNTINWSSAIEITHFSKEDQDIKYIDESYTIYDRVPDDYVSRNQRNGSLEKQEANNNQYTANVSYKENKFPVEDNGYLNGNRTDAVENNHDRKKLENEYREQPPVPKVRKKKFTKAKLLGFFNGK